MQTLHMPGWRTYPPPQAGEKLVVDLFAGGGGASVGIEAALRRTVDIAVNHDKKALALHRINHPGTLHLACDVFEVDPREVTRGRPVGLLWASPDCTYHSKARGGKPIRHKNKKRRALAWVVVRWQAQVRPDVVAMENVEEFPAWGPLVARRDKTTGRVVRADKTVAAPGEVVPVGEQELVPDPAREGETYWAWRGQMALAGPCDADCRFASPHRSRCRRCRKLANPGGYVVDAREIRACAVGIEELPAAPTIRKRWFLIARCDGEPVVWPADTHAPPESAAVRTGELKAYRTAAECIDFTIPMLSIFATKEEAKMWGKKHGRPAPIRPLAPATMRRIARGVKRFVIDSPKPFLVHLTHHGEQRAHSLDGQMPTAVAAFLAQNNGGFYDGDGHPVDRPSSTILGTGSHQSLCAASLVKLRGTSSDADPADPLHCVSAGGTHHGLVAASLVTNTTGHGPTSLDGQVPTLTTGDQQALAAAYVQRDFGHSAGHAADDPLGTVTAGGGGHAAAVYAFLQAYYGTDQDTPLSEGLHTVTTKDRYGLVTVMVDGHPMVIVDICMRMLQPRPELFRAQGFPDSYTIAHGEDEDGNLISLTKTEQVRMCGNSVCPPIAAALVRANLPHMVNPPPVKRAAPGSRDGGCTPMRPAPEATR